GGGPAPIQRGEVGRLEQRPDGRLRGRLRLPRLGAGAVRPSARRLTQIRRQCGPVPDDLSAQGAELSYVAPSTDHDLSPLSRRSAAMATRDPEANPAAFLGDELRRVRLAAGFSSQDALAVRMGFDRPVITKVESGDRPPSA